MTITNCHCIAISVLVCLKNIAHTIFKGQIFDINKERGSFFRGEEYDLEFLSDLDIKLTKTIGVIHVNLSKQNTTNAYPKCVNSVIGK